MSDLYVNQTSARHQIRERVARASAPHVSGVRRRHRLAEQLRRVADKLDA